MLIVYSSISDVPVFYYCWYGIEKGGGGSVKRHDHLFIQMVEPKFRLVILMSFTSMARFTSSA